MVDERFKKGIELFNEEEFFESHEVIEDLWLATQDEYKNLYKGVIQASVSMHHLRNGNVNGARKLYKTASQYLNQYKTDALGLNVNKLLKDLEKTIKETNHIKFPKMEFIEGD